MLNGSRNFEVLFSLEWGFWKEFLKHTLFTGITWKGPPAPLLIIAMNFGFTAQKSESHVISVIRTSDIQLSCLTGLQKTCRNLLWRTIPDIYNLFGRFQKKIKIFKSLKTIKSKIKRVNPKKRTRSRSTGSQKLFAIASSLRGGNVLASRLQVFLGWCMLLCVLMKQTQLFSSPFLFFTLCKYNAKREVQNYTSACCLFLAINFSFHLQNACGLGDQAYFTQYLRVCPTVCFQKSLVMFIINS